MSAATAVKSSRQIRRLQNAETKRPSSTSPTISPPPTETMSPTVTNSSMPSLMPSLSAANSSSSEADIEHTLKVSEKRVMEATEEDLYELIMENLTLSIGYMVEEPLIESNCTVINTRVGEMRRYLQVTGTSTDNSTAIEQYVLFVSFKINYVSRYDGYDVTSYPEYLKDYINDNQDKVTEYLQTVINFGSSDDYILQSESAYIIVGTDPPSPRPTVSPSLVPSELPSFMPSLAPSDAPTDYLPPALGLGTGEIVGIAIGSFFGVILIFVCMRTLSKRNHSPKMNMHEEQYDCDCPQDNDNVDDSNNMFVVVPTNDADNISSKPAPEEEAPSHIQVSHNRLSSIQSNISSHSDGRDSPSILAAATESQEQLSMTSPTSTDHSLTSSQSKQTLDMGTFVGTNLLMRDDSFSSDSHDDGLSREHDIDEFDQYKNDILEELRDEVEKSIYDVDSMMSMAMTRIFMEAEGSSLDLSWVGAEDPASIEASCYFEAFDWKKQNVIPSAREDFFQDMLNRIVQIVHRGLIRPQDGARLIHGCAAILDMRLLRELPSTTVVIRGLRKTNNLAQGHHFLVQSLGIYGDIIDASISPKNKGFGFVRFVQPQSVATLMKKYEASDVEVQDVSVSIIPISRV